MEALLKDGLQIMALGMSGVFLFLIIMVFFIFISSKMVQKFGKPEEASSVESGAGVSKSHIAAISAAISSYLKISSRNK